MPRLADQSLRLHLLRGFSLANGGRTLDLPLGAQRLIAFLALQDRPVHRLAVSGTLWIDASEEQASASLRTVLWRVGRIADVVTATGPTLELARGLRIDVRQAEQRAALLLSAPEEYCEQDLCVLGGDADLLPDWYDEWVIIERERFRQLRLHALEALCRALALVGAHPDAISAGLAAVAAEPLRESAHRALMAAHVAEGNVCEALRQFEFYRRHLAEAVQLEPSPRMHMLVARLRAV